MTATSRGASEDLGVSVGNSASLIMPNLPPETVAEPPRQRQHPDHHAGEKPSHRPQIFPKASTIMVRPTGTRSSRVDTENGGSTPYDPPLERHYEPAHWRGAPIQNAK